MQWLAGISWFLRCLHKRCAARAAAVLLACVSCGLARAEAPVMGAAERNRAKSKTVNVPELLAARERLAQVPERVPSQAPPPAASAEGTAAADSSPLGPGRIRLPLLDDSARRIGATPEPTPQTLQLYNQFVERTIDPDNTLDLVKGRPRVLVFKQPPIRVQIGDEKIANFDPITDRELSVIGYETGDTVLNVWFADPAAPGQQRVLSYLVRVVPDPEAKERLERVYKGLELEINRSFPNSAVQIALVGDKMVVRGEAKDIVEAAQILQICAANAPRQNTNQQVRAENLNVNVGGYGAGGYFGGSPYGDGFDGSALDSFDPATGNPQGPGTIDYILRGSPNLINLLRVPGEQQVMLRVTVAEVNRSAARSIGLNLSVANTSGLTVFAQLSGLGTGATTATGGNLPTLLDQGQVRLAITALRNLNLARSMAEPNLVTLNGQPAYFSAGGSFPITTSVGTAATVAQTVQYIPLGVNLIFTPYVTDRERVRLNLRANVRTRSDATVAAGGTTVPANVDQRSFQTSVELRTGQTIAVAGLVQNTFGATANRVPLWGDLPVIGWTGGQRNTTANESELVVLVTPELVHPLEAGQTPQVPGSDSIEPGDVEFYLFGRLEGRRRRDARSPTRTDYARIMAQLRYRDQYIIGATGQTWGGQTVGDPQPGPPAPSGETWAPEEIVPRPRPTRSGSEAPRELPPPGETP